MKQNKSTKYNQMNNTQDKSMTEISWKVLKGFQIKIKNLKKH